MSPFQGENSTPEVKTYPKIKIEGHEGPARVVVSCVAHQGEKPRVHPYNLVSPAVRSSSRNSGCKNGICFKRVSHVPGQDLTVEFQHLGIQCVTRGKIGEALRQREQIRVDPFGQGFDHTNGPTAVDLSAVRLCFQVQTMPDNVISPVFLAFVSIFCKVFLDFPKRKHSFPLPPVLSKPIFDARAKKELQVKIISKSSLETTFDQIMDISETDAPAEGGKKIIILCERVARNDIVESIFLLKSIFDQLSHFRSDSMTQRALGRVSAD